MKSWAPFERDRFSIAAIEELAFGFQRSRVVLTAWELGIFSALGTGKKNAVEIAEIVQCNKSAVERLLNVLCSIELLEKTNDQYQNLKHTIRYLVEGKPEYMSNLQHNNYLWQSWSHLTEAVKNGVSSNIKDMTELDDNQIYALLEAMNWRAKWLGPDLVRMIELNGATKILDLGGGSGTYSMEFVKFKPGLDVTIFELPNVVKFTNNYLKAENFQNTIKVIEGDFRKDDFGNGYDIVFISFVLHSYSIFENIKLMQKVYDSLNPGGKIVIQDFIINDDRISPDIHAMFDLNLLVNTDHGNILAETDLWIMLKEAWFKEWKRFDIELGASLIEAHK